MPPVASASITLAWLGELLDDEETACRLVELLASEWEHSLPQHGLDDDPEHYGPMAPAIASAQEIERELKEDMLRALIETPPVDRPAPHRHHRMRVAA